MSSRIRTVLAIALAAFVSARRPEPAPAMAIVCHTRIRDCRFVSGWPISCRA